MREPYLMVAVGKKAVGKSYQTRLLMKQYIQSTNRKILILDVNDEYDDVQAIRLNDVLLYGASKTPRIKRIRPYEEGTGRRYSLDEIASVQLAHILENYSGGMLLAEDINKYVSDSMPKDLVGMICTNRHIDLDVILHYQGLGAITPKLWRNINWMRFHKNTESVDRHKNKFPDKYPYLKIAENIVNSRYMSGDKRFFLYVETDEGRIQGDFSKKEFDEACVKYIGENYNTTLRPILNNPLGKKLSKDEAVTKKLQEFTELHYGNS